MLVIRVLGIAVIMLGFVASLSHANADEGGASAGASVVDPYTMPAEEAKIWCFENPESKKCQILEERWREEARDPEGGDRHGYIHPLGF